MSKISKEFTNKLNNLIKEKYTNSNDGILDENQYDEIFNTGYKSGVREGRRVATKEFNNDRTKIYNRSFYSKDRPNQFTMIMNEGSEWIGKLGNKSGRAVYVLMFMITNMNQSSNIYDLGYQFLEESLGISVDIRKKTIKILRDLNYIKHHGKSTHDGTYIINSRLGFSGGIKNRINLFDAELKE